MKRCGVLVSGFCLSFAFHVGGPGFEFLRYNRNLWNVSGFFFIVIVIIIITLLLVLILLRYTLRSEWHFIITIEVYS